MAERLALVGYGPSVYCWVVQMALAELGLEADYIATDPFADTPDPVLATHTRFDRVPVLLHGDFKLTETAAILRYLDAISGMPSLVPAEPKAAARMAQVMGIMDADVYWPMVRGVFSHGYYFRHIGLDPDPEELAKGLARSAPALEVLDAIAAEGLQLSGPKISLADMQLAPMIGYFTRAPEGAAALAERSNLSRWWREISQRSSLRETDPLADL